MPKKLKKNEEIKAQKKKRKKLLIEK